MWWVAMLASKVEKGSAGEEVGKEKDTGFISSILSIDSFSVSTIFMSKVEWYVSPSPKMTVP